MSGVSRIPRLGIRLVCDGRADGERMRKRAGADGQSGTQRSMSQTVRDRRSPSVA